MRPLSANDIESELSYAYLHAVAAKASVACKIGSRHDDNAGVDAELTGWGPFPAGGYREEVDIKVQLKATTRALVQRDGLISYNLQGIARYDDLRCAAISTPRILVVLFLPDNREEWLIQNDEALSLRKCAYWVSLRGAAPSSNKSAQTVYLPVKQRFDVMGLKTLMGAISRNETPTYEGGAN